MIPDDDTTAETSGEEIFGDDTFTPPPHRDLLVVPDSPSDFPDIPLDLIAEAEAMIMDPEQYAKAKPLLDAMGSGNWINGGSAWDHARLVFDIQDAAKANGHRGLARAKANEISRAFTWAWYRRTHMRLKDLRKQGKLLAIERQQQIRDMRNAAE